MRAIDLFCGAGGFSVGLVRAGFEVVFASDIDEDACKTYKINHPQTLVYKGDIQNISGKHILDLLGMKAEDIDVIVGGPPCQGFSTVGKKDENDPRNRLFLHYFRIVEEIRPKVIVFENVVGFQKLYGGKAYDAVCKELEKLGYAIMAKILNAVNFGVPQNRERIFIIGHEPKIHIEWPSPTHSGGRGLFDINLKEPLTLFDAISDLPIVESGEEANYYLSEPKNDYQKERRKSCTILTEHIGPKHGKRLIELIKMVPPGGCILDVPKEFRPKSFFSNTYARLRWHEPAPTITRNFGTPSSSRCIHPVANRGLTTREGARLQGFDDDYIFFGSRLSKNLQIGNAVPPLLAEAIFKEIYKSLQKLKDTGYGRQKTILRKIFGST